MIQKVNPTTTKAWKELETHFSEMTFQSLGLVEPILKALQHEGYETPTPIQAQAIPVVLEGTDLIFFLLL